MLGCKDRFSVNKTTLETILFKKFVQGKLFYLKSVYTHICVCIYLYIYAYVCIYSHACVYVCIFVHFLGTTYSIRLNTMKTV